VPGPTGPTGSQGQPGTGVTIKGSVSNSGALPPTGNQTGDGYITTDTGHLWTWDGDSWVDAGPIVGPTGPAGPTGPTGAAGGTYTIIQPGDPGDPTLLPPGTANVPLWVDEDDFSCGTGGGGGGVTDHGDLTGLADPDSHPIGAVTGLQAALDAKADVVAFLPLILPGSFVDQSFVGLAPGTIAGVANTIVLAPYVAPKTFSVDQVGVSVSTLIAGALGRIVIYDSTAAGLPNAPIFVSGDLDFSTTGDKVAATSLTFQQGRTYWIGVWASSTATLRGIAVGGVRSLGLLTNAATSYVTALRRTITFVGGSAPNPWNYVAGDRQSLVVPSVRMRVV